MPKKTIDDLPNDVQIEIRTFPKNNEIWIEAVNAFGEAYWLDGEERVLFGLKAEKWVDPASGKEVWRVINTEATQGWGPFVYDLAMEVASSDGRDGLLTGTGLTLDSTGVWEYYRAKRPDVLKKNFSKGHPWMTKGIVDADFPFLWSKEPDLFPKLEQLGKISKKHGAFEVEVKPDDALDDQLKKLFEENNQD